MTLETLMQCFRLATDPNAAISPSVYSSAIGTSPSIEAFRDWSGWDAYLTNARRLRDFTVVYTGKQAVSPYSSTILMQGKLFSTAAADSCAARCKVDPYCGAVEMAIERVPSTPPTTASPNPAAKFAVSCHLHNKQLSPADANFTGRFDQKFYRTQTGVTFFNRNGWRKAYPATLGQSCARSACGKGFTCDTKGKVCRLGLDELCGGPQDDSTCASGLCSFSSELSYARCVPRGAGLVPQDRHCLSDADCKTANCSGDVKRCGAVLPTTTVTVTVAPQKTTVTSTVTATATTSVDGQMTDTLTQTNTLTVPVTAYSTILVTLTSTAEETTYTTATVTVNLARRALHTTYHNGVAYVNNLKLSQLKARAVSGPTVTVTTTAPVETITATATQIVTVTATRSPARTTATMDVTVTTTTSVPTTITATTTTTEVQTLTTTTVVPNPTPTYTARVKMVKTSDGSSMGYIGGLNGGFGTSKLVDSSADAIAVTFTPSNTGFFNINAPAGSKYPYLGLVYGTQGNSRDFGGDAYLNIGYTAAVAPGTMSSDTNQNTPAEAGLPGYYESQVWSFDRATKMLSASWTQADGCECVFAVVSEHASPMRDDRIAPLTCPHDTPSRLRPAQIAAPAWYVNFGNSDVTFLEFGTQSFVVSIASLATQVVSADGTFAKSTSSTPADALMGCCSESGGRDYRMKELRRFVCTGSDCRQGSARSAECNVTAYARRSACSHMLPNRQHVCVQARRLVYRLGMARKKQLRDIRHTILPQNESRVPLASSRVSQVGRCSRSSSVVVVVLLLVDGPATTTVHTLVLVLVNLRPGGGICFCDPKSNRGFSPAKLNMRTRQTHAGRRFEQAQ